MDPKPIRPRSGFGSDSVFRSCDREKRIVPDRKITAWEWLQLLRLVNCTLKFLKHVSPLVTATLLVFKKSNINLSKVVFIYFFICFLLFHVPYMCHSFFVFFGVQGLMCVCWLFSTQCELGSIPKEAKTLTLF